MADPGGTTNPFASPAGAASSPWDDIPDDFFLSTSISSPSPSPSPPPPPAAIPSTLPCLATPHRSASLPPASASSTTTSASASFSDPRPRAAPASHQHQPQLIHPSHSLPAFPSAAAQVWSPPLGPHHTGSIPEFAAAPASGAHRPPARTAVRADCPPPLDLRPCPPRESHAGATLRALAYCCDASRSEASVGARLWAAGEAGVRAWDLADAFRSPASQQRWGDEASAPFKESRRTSPARAEGGGRAGAELTETRVDA